MKNILVTGGTGFIGSHTCISLLENGHNVTIVDSLINSSESVIERIKKVLKLSNNFDERKINFYYILYTYVRRSNRCFYILTMV